MDDRHDLERILLDGLSDEDRRQTLASISAATAEKLAHLRSLGDGGNDCAATESSADEHVAD